MHSRIFKKLCETMLMRILYLYPSMVVVHINRFAKRIMTINYKSITVARIIIFSLIGVSVLCIVLLWKINTFTESYEFNTGNVIIKHDSNYERTIFIVEKLDRITHRIELNGFKVGNEFKIIEDSNDFSLIKVSIAFPANEMVSHCIHLETGHMHWFGGPQIYDQYWPVEKLQLKDYSYVPKEVDHIAVAERFWFNSRGGFIYVDDKVPLFIDQNVKNSDKLCLKAQIKLPYNPRAISAELTYYLGMAKDSRDAHRKAVERFLKKPTGLVDRRMVEHPIWNTWARFKRNINESSVEKYASEIEKFGFKNNQLDIDDGWEKCYGSLEFRSAKFSNIQNQTDGLRARGFRVTLWVHPFINKGCEPWYSEAKRKGYLVENHRGNPDTTWWNSQSNGAAHIDFTNPDAAEWYLNRLKKLQKEAKIDTFKFDAGETSWIPSDPKLNVDIADHPLAITKAYVRVVSQFGPMVEVRAGYQTQDLNIFLRFLDKDTEWGFNNGLATLITTLLQLNMVGYRFILPDMIGGNGYDQPPSEELFIRWLQANVFMPTVQYSFAPWEYSKKAVEICRHFTKLHAQYTDEIMKAFENAVNHGEPVNPPIWWLDPHDKIALRIDDEFLLGDRILSAPITKEGAVTRNIYLPKSKWYDPNQNKTHTGPCWLNDYPAPINVLPYFIRQDFDFN